MWAAKSLLVVWCIGAQMLVCFNQVFAQGLQNPVEASVQLLSAARADDASDGAWMDVATVQSPQSESPTFSGDGRWPVAPLGVTARLWYSSGRADIGFGLGSVATYSVNTFAASPVGWAGSLPIRTLGFRYRLSEEHLLLADSATVRGSAAVFPQSTRSVGVQWTPSGNQLGLESGAVGFQLDSGYKLSLKASAKKLTLMMRKRF